MLTAGRMNLDRSMERLSSGLRISSGQDDASGLAISDHKSLQAKVNQVKQEIDRIGRDTTFSYANETAPPSL